MKTTEILEHYTDSSLDKISTDKMDEAVNLRLPRSVVIQEVSEALNSLTYVGKVLAPAKPPTYSFLKLLLESHDYTRSIEGFQEKVIADTNEMMTRAESGKGLPDEKDYKIYLKVLKTAWEDDVVERSEALLLQSLREELGIWTREHLLLEHHPEINPNANLLSAYIDARNHLLVTGLVLVHEDNYLLSDEVALHLKQAWGIELTDDTYLRLLTHFQKPQLQHVLEKSKLPTSGNKDELIQRILNALVPPGVVLEHLHIDELRDLARDTKAQVSGLKAEVIGNLIDFFDKNKDLEDRDVQKPEKTVPEEPEERELKPEILPLFLQKFSNDHLYDILSASNLKTSGTKDIKILQLVNSIYSERSMLNRLRRIELYNICKKFGIQVSGVKKELVDRLIEWGQMNFIETHTRAELGELNNIQDSDPTMSDINEIPKLEQLDVPNITPAPVSGLDDIKRSYPDLDLDEQVILALIKETKSLTEHDIERASSHHGFEWFLTKAHMAEMVAKLKKADSLPIRVRSVKSINIYEWVGNRKDAPGDLDLQSARDVIDALRHGVVPENNLDRLMVGQDIAREHLKDLLVEISHLKSAFKFIRGPYGAGKSFLCSWLRQYALDNEYVVSLINISADQPLSDLPLFYSGIINGIRTIEKRDSSALTDVLESWLLASHKKTAKIEGLNPFDKESKRDLIPLVKAKIESELADIGNCEPCYSVAINAFYEARMTGDHATASNVVAWLSGSRSISTKVLNDIGIRGYLEANQVFPRIRALLKLISESRFNGFLCMVDELELIRKFPHTRQREQALETLRLLIDETGKNDLPGCLLIFTGTDTFFDDERAGLRSYEALHNRVAQPIALGGKVSVRQPVIRLEGLNRERLMSVVKKVRDIHGMAYDWDSQEKLSDSFLEKLILEWTSFEDESVSRRPRPVLREFIHILDLCEENPSVSQDDLLRSTSETF